MLSRRSFMRGASLPTVWSSPIIYSVMLPIHAQTSMCNVIDISGRWKISISNGDPSAFEIDIPTDTEPLTRSSSGSVYFEMNIPYSDTIYTVDDMDGQCKKMYGHYDNIAGISGPDSPVAKGTWLGEFVGGITGTQ